MWLTYVRARTTGPVPKWGRFDGQVDEMRNVAGKKAASWEFLGVSVIQAVIGPMVSLQTTSTNEGSVDNANDE